MSIAASTEAVVDTSSEKPFHVCDNDVTQHTVSDHLKLYPIPQKDIQNKLEFAVPSQFKDFSKTLHESTIILRKPSLNIIKELRESEQKTPPKFILYGPVGSGKSLSLLHVIHYCLSKDWIVLHVPNGFHFIDRQGKTQVQESQWKTPRADQPEESMLWLNRFRNMNLKFLEETKTTQVYKWGKRETTDKDQPLMNVLEQGVGRSMFSTDAVGVILKEIQQNENLNVLYAVDGFNGFYGKTSHKLNGSLVELENLSLVRHFTKLLQPEYSLSKGAYVMAISQSTHYLNERHGYEVAETIPETVLDDLGSYTAVEVPNYNDQEYEVILKYYREKRWLSKELDDSIIREIKFLTNSNPLLLRKFCASL